ncbi:hypothetical protein SEVIR_4G285400v4 [Setaria viridis]
MGAYDDEEAISEHVALGACSHVLKPLHAGSLNILKQKALEHKFKKATPQGPISSRTQSRMVSSFTKRPQEMLVLDRNDLPNPGSNEFEVPKVRKARGSEKPGRVKWTIDLHEKFLDAIEVLGDKSKLVPAHGLKFKIAFCFLLLAENMITAVRVTDAKPEGILKLMNVKGLTSKQISSHLQKHRLLQRNAKQGGQHQRNASRKPVSELIGSAHNAATTESITPTVDADSREVYPSRLWTQVKEAAVLKTCMYTCASGIYRGDRKSVWDEYEKDLQKDFSTSSRRWQQIGVPLSKCQLPVKNNVVIDAGVSSEALKAAGEIGYGASIESSDSSSLSAGLVDQVGENNRTKAAGINDNVGNINLLEGTMNKEHTAALDPSDLFAFLQSNNVDLLGPPYGREEDTPYWMSQPLEGLQNQQNLGLEDPLQVDDAWNKGLASLSLINIDGPMTQEATVQNAPQEATIQNDPVNNPVMPIAQDDGLSLVQQYLGLEDLLQVDNAWNKGLASPSVVNIDGPMAQEGTIQNPPAHNPEKPIAQDDGFSQDQQNLGLEDLLQVDNEWNKGLASPSVINIDGPMAQAGTIQNPPAHNPVKPTAQDDEFWSWSPLGDFDMLI